MRVILKIKLIILTLKLDQMNSETTLTKCFIELANSLNKMTDDSTSHYSIMWTHPEF